MSNQSGNSEAILKHIKLLSDIQYGKGASSEQIYLLEKSIDAEIKGEFRRFLEVVGWLSATEFEVYGLGTDTPAHLKILERTIEERSIFEPRLPKFLLPISNDGTGSHYCLELRRVDLFEYPVVFWDHELGSGQAIKEVFPNFMGFLSEMLNLN